MAHDERPCLLCLFFHRPCGFSGFGRSLGGISGSLTGVFGGGILLFDGLLLLPAGKRVAGKLGTFLQRFLVQKYPLYAEDCTEYFKSGEEAFE